MVVGKYRCEDMKLVTECAQRRGEEQYSGEARVPTAAWFPCSLLRYEYGMLARVD